MEFLTFSRTQNLQFDFYLLIHDFSVPFFLTIETNQQVLSENRNFRFYEAVTNRAFHTEPPCHFFARRHYPVAMKARSTVLTAATHYVSW